MRSVGRRGLSDHSFESDHRIIGLLAAAQSASELRLQAAQSASELRLQAAQSVIKDELQAAQKVIQAAQSASELRLQAAQSASELRLQAAQKVIKDELQAAQSASELRFGEIINLNSYKLLGATCTAFVTILAAFLSVGGVVSAPWSNPKTQLKKEPQTVITG
jgi:hypothetical protein